MASTAVHATLTGIELHYSKLQVIVGAPSSIPTYIGQTQYDQTNNILYIATGVASLSDWKSQSSTPTVIETASATYTATESNNGNIIAMTNSTSRTFNLPTNPINGFFIGVQDSAATGAYTNTINVSSGGNLIIGSGSLFKITSDNACILFVYDFASSTWIISSSYSGLQPTFEKIRGTDSGDALTITATDFEISKTFLLDDITDITKQLTINLSGATTGTKTTLIIGQTANRSLTFPDITDTLVSKNTTDIFTNKSFNSATTLLAANQLRFNNSANTFYTSIIGGNNSANLSLTLPIIAPAAGQFLYSTDIIGTLGWTNATSLANVAANDTDITFIISDNRFQTCLPTTNRTYTLPSTGIVAGDTWTFSNRSTNYLAFIILEASDSSRIGYCFCNGETIIQAITSNPTSNAGWCVISSSAAGSYTNQAIGGGTGAFAGGADISLIFIQKGNNVSISGKAVSTGSPPASTSAATSIYTIPNGGTYTSAYGIATPTSTSSTGAFIGGSLTLVGASIDIFLQFSSAVTSITAEFSGSYIFQ
jgi:hypothetical protein